MIVTEYRVLLPMTVEEYQLAQLWSVAEASKGETGGGEGVEIVKNEPFEAENGKGQYTLKIYHFPSRVLAIMRTLAPNGSMELQEESWNSYPYCKTVITNPTYMKDNFLLSIETWHKPDFGDSENVHQLPSEEWEGTRVIKIDIANDPIHPEDYKEDQDPKKFSPKAEGRGPLTEDWIERMKSQENGMPHMCAYKLVKCHFNWTSVQARMENLIHRHEQRLFTKFHRQVYCWMDNWLGLTMEDIRKKERETKEELDEMRQTGSVRGMMPSQ